MKMYAKNQEVAACLPAVAKLKHFRLRGERRGEHQTPDEGTEAGINDDEIARGFIYFRPRVVPIPFLSSRSRLGIAGKSRKEAECV